MDLTSGSMWDKIILYTLPIIFTGLMQTLYHAVDMAVVGHSRMAADLFIAQSGGPGGSFKPMIAAVFSVCIFRTLYLKTVYPMIGGYLAIILIFPISLLLNTLVQAIFYRSTRQRIGKELEAKAAQAVPAGVSA